MTAPAALNENEVAEVRAKAAAGRPVTVWFTAAAVGVPVGGSAKVVAVGEIAEDDFIQVRRTGARDTMYCSPNELTLIRPVRRRAAAGVRSEATITTPSTTRHAPGSVGTSASPPAEEAPSSAQSRKKPAAAGPAPAVGSAGRAAGGFAEISVRLNATAEGEWSVEVLVGTKRIVPSTPVHAASMAMAARSLPPAVSEAIEPALERARQLQRTRVDHLRAELDAAQRVLDQFDA